MFTERAALGSKIEAVENVAEVIAAADLNLLIYDLKWTPEPVVNERNPASMTFGELGPVMGGCAGTVSFKVELKGSGVAGTAPAIGKLLRCASMTETILAAYRVRYQTTSVRANVPSLTFKVWYDGKYFTFKGCRASSMKLSPKAGEIGFLDCEFKGSYEAEGDLATPVPTGIEDLLPQPFMSMEEVCGEFDEDRITSTSGVIGVEELLRSGAATNLRLSVSFLPSATRQVRRARIYIDQQGVCPPGNIWCEIQGDAAGVPDNAPILGGTSETIVGTSIAPGMEYVDFYFTAAVPPTVVAATPYHLVLNGGYAFGAVGIEWATVVCLLAAERSHHFDAAWLNVGLKNFIYELICAPLIDVRKADMELDWGLTFTPRPDYNDAQGIGAGWITNMKPRVTFKAEEQLAASRDWWELWRAQTPMYEAWRLGSVAGNIVKLTCGNVRVGKAQEIADEGGIVTNPITLNLLERTYGSSDDTIILDFC